MLPQYSDATITRTRDYAVLDTMDVVVDVGGVYDPAKDRYDHHQVPKANYYLVIRIFGLDNFQGFLLSPIQDTLKQCRSDLQVFDFDFCKDH